MKESPATPASYLASLPPERREALSVVRAAILKNLPEGYVESTGWGMITYCIPLARFSQTYNGHPLAIAALGSQKNYMAVHLMNIYGSPKIRDWFFAEYKKAGKRLDAGKGCIRFRKLDDLPVALIGQTIAKTSVDELIEWHELVHAPRRAARRTARTSHPAKKPAKASRQPSKKSKS